MGHIVSLAAYKKEKGIAAPRSPYYTLKATDAEIRHALQQAHHRAIEIAEQTGQQPYAVVVGYEDQRGRTKLLKEICFYPNRETFENSAGHKNMKVIALVANDQ